MSFNLDIYVAWQNCTVWPLKLQSIIHTVAQQLVQQQLRFPEKYPWFEGFRSANTTSFLF